MDVRVLGPLEIEAGGCLVRLGPQQRRVFLALLLQAGQVVSGTRLGELMWGEPVPKGGAATLRSHVMRVRRALRAAAGGEPGGITLVTQGGGYALRVCPGQMDTVRFEALLAQGRDALAAGDSWTAGEGLRSALGLWRGPAFTEVADCAFALAEVARLEGLRRVAMLARIEADLAVGRHGELVGELEGLLAAAPGEETLRRFLALALYRCQRADKAAWVCQQGLKLLLDRGLDSPRLQDLQRDILRGAPELGWAPPTSPRTLAAAPQVSTPGPAPVEELGINPSPGLKRRDEQILTTDPALTASPALPSVSASRPVPHQLPAYTPHFVGRAAELHQLSTLLDTTTTGGGTVVITAIDGIAGIGKTALALHWAHQTAERFADGQLYVNLRGFDPTSTPMHPTEALRGFLAAFGISPELIPTSVEAQAGLYRSLLTNRRMLIVLDNARDAEQVRPLLPASPTCLVVITSRNQLAGLIAQQGARPITLDVLSPQEARALLVCHLGPQRVGTEPRAITELIKYCAGLPLALAIVAARAATHPGFTLQVLAKELADEHTRLDALDTGEAATSVRAVFSWSYQHLSPPAARMFRLLGLHPGPDIALPAAAHLTDIPLHQAREALSELTRAHLLTQHTPGRYAFHDLLRAYATHLTTTHDAPENHHTALTRLFDHYLHTAATTMNTLQPADQHHRFQTPLPVVPTPPLTEPTTAQNWLTAEEANLAAIITYTAAHGWHTHTTQLANTVFHSYYFGAAYYPHALTLYTDVQHAAHHTNDHTTEARALTHLGYLHWMQGHYPQAIDHHQQALIICRDIGDRAVEALVLFHLGLVHWRQGRYPQAIDHYQQALTISRDIGERTVEARALTTLGLVHWTQGRYQQAIDHHQQALTICRDIGYRTIEAIALTHLGLVHWTQGRYPQAIDHHQQALTICRDIGFRAFEAIALINLGLVHWMQGRYPQAIDHHQQALTICRDIGDRALEAIALTNLGLVHWTQGRYPQAIDHHQQALTICRDIGGRCDEAQILNGLGKAYHANGQLDQAHTQHTAALTLATEIGDRREQANAHHGLAHTHYATNNLDQAHHHQQLALTLYTHLDIPNATIRSIRR